MAGPYRKTAAIFEHRAAGEVRPRALTAHLWGRVACGGNRYRRVPEEGCGGLALKNVKKISKGIDVAFSFATQ